MRTYRTGASASRRTALAGIGAGGLGLALAALVRQASARDATPGPLAADADVIRAAERERLRALVEGDMGAADRLHADDFQLINPAGGALSKAEYLGALAAGDIDYVAFEPASEIAVRLYGEAAAIRYRSNLEIVVGGQDDGLGHYWHTDLYERRDGRWQSVWSQATQIL